MTAERPVAVVALGGNALIRQGERGTVAEQLHHIRESVRQLPALLGAGYGLVITHGNGPVVGHLLLQNEAARDLVPPMPLDVCDADSEGSIGYLTQQALVNEIRNRGGCERVVSLITQVLVDPKDPGFSNPTKPVGPFYDLDEVTQLSKKSGWRFREDAGRGYRRVVPSPLPIEVVEEEIIRLLVREGVVVIAAGGGGIPVIRGADGDLEGVEAVIDKDRVSALLAKRLGARLMVILTAERGVCTDYGKPTQKEIPRLGVAEARRLLAAGEFPEGSMGPKMEAAIDFIEGGGERVVITLPELLEEALAGNCGTSVYP